jgi:imidazole glycerol-phosphate synthase subunit HisH
MKVVVVKYNAGNTSSVLYSLSHIGIAAMLSDDANEIRSADKVIFPGVGAAGPAMDYLREKGIDEIITGLKQPVLGICLGMQLFCAFSQEENTPCLNIIGEDVVKFSGNIKVPHIGWNNIAGLQSPLFSGIDNNAFMYFVHSYYVPLCDATIATADYSLLYSAALQKDNFYGVQFHPEKSGLTGQKILENFIKL